MVLTYHKGSQRSYIFLVHDKDFARYRRILDQFTSQWRSLFTEEYTDFGDVAGKGSGESITIEKANGDLIRGKGDTVELIDFKSEKKPDDKI